MPAAMGGNPLLLQTARRRAAVTLTVVTSIAAAVGLSCSTDRRDLPPATTPHVAADGGLDDQLADVLSQHGFTGRVESTLPSRLGRSIDPDKAELGRLLFFDSILGLYGDNSCAGCHSPTAAMADTQSIAIGVDNNEIVGPSRAGPRNQRRAPSVINSAFYPNLMWNGRFASLSGDAFDNSRGFEFPAPEGTTRFPPGDLQITHLLVAQAHMPVTELPELAGFRNIAGSLASSSRFQVRVPPGKESATLARPGAAGAPGGSAALSEGSAVPDDRRHLHIQVFPEWDLSSTLPTTVAAADAEPDFIQFDDGEGTPLPPPDSTDSRNEPIRTAVVALLNGTPAYRQRFARLYPKVADGGPIQYAMVGQTIAEFLMSLSFADAPIDQFARGDRAAMTDAQKRGALLFFGKARCVECHAVAGVSGEMFSDFRMHTVGVPQVAPRFGRGAGNIPFRNRAGRLVARGNEDWGRYDITEDPADRFKFRTPPLRNVALQPAFFHNGAFTRLEDAIRHNLDPKSSARSYDPVAAGVDEDLRHNVGPIEPVLEQLDPILTEPVVLTDAELADLVTFVRDGLTDERAKPENLRRLIPTTLPSGRTVPKFE